MAYFYDVNELDYYFLLLFPFVFNDVQEYKTLPCSTACRIQPANYRKTLSFHFFHIFAFTPQINSITEIRRHFNGEHFVFVGLPQKKCTTFGVERKNEN